MGINHHFQDMLDIMIESIEKDKIAKNFCYILKTKMLETILAGNELDVFIDLNYWLSKNTGSIFEARYQNNVLKLMQKPSRN